MEAKRLEAVSVTDPEELVKVCPPSSSAAPADVLAESTELVIACPVTDTFALAVVETVAEPNELVTELPEKTAIELALELTVPGVLAKDVPLAWTVAFACGVTL